MSTFEIILIAYMLCMFFELGFQIEDSDGLELSNSEKIGMLVVILIAPFSIAIQLGMLFGGKLQK